MITVKNHTETNIIEILQEQHFEVEVLNEKTYQVQRGEELPVFISHQDDALYFEVDLGSFKNLQSEELMFKLLDLNTEILPVSFGLDNIEPENPRLVLVESRSCVDLQQEELLAVFDALELATDKAESLLTGYLK